MWASSQRSPFDRAAGFLQNEQSKRPAWKLQPVLWHILWSHTVTASVCVELASYPYLMCEGTTQKEQVRIMVEWGALEAGHPSALEFNHEISWSQHGDRKVTSAETDMPWMSAHFNSVQFSEFTCRASISCILTKMIPKFLFVFQKAF